MAITAALVKELRDRTGAGMMDCKKALVETNADLEAAIDLMRASGAAKAAKKAGRVASEGLVNVTISDDNKQAAILEVNSETDFVTKGSAFIDFVDSLGRLALKNKPESVESFLGQKLDSGETVDEARENIIAKIGENISVRRVQIISTETGILGAYKHGDRIAVLTVLASQDSALAKDVAMHIAASRPECISEDQLSEELLEREKAIFIEQARESGKPDNIIEKMIVGRMKKFVNEVTLYGQSFVKDPDVTVGELVKSNNSKVESFVRYEVGEGIEKKEDNFVEEVMAQAQA
ncbi:translation elongation factor Ts [Candidatus Pseudothioglobus singularis]|jgi:elongation factor Ts|uniref:translation elongation factor Ts n=1 Tax=Candidatus Pseudothioglobus singularis TaxID=1427364 RepID=UPI0008063F3F|nr:translation elongation factor Ts [Candidatus Pseudothioglobus singularis]MDG1167180.1 translation elongation factor Ts [Candidatus Thioglobus sp.]MDP0596160.1 translation elongation factor Ts [SAR86 cluster bacterium]ANQ65779.1 elongation factor Ts [Candidatus Pseudothioglobus singularis]MDA8855487.1 translation elongation factor Ts [Candidatus Pseudothioglobus singularis]MDB0021840.1 translation elongation factor Ts [Candidatus Pseudothioglobus singularis]|tara:strand:- start:31 stop:909 length:879 start_codon:yes stop_codon:yes gene_type:complete